MSEGLNALEIVHQIVERIAPGRPPAYTEAHVLKALELLGGGLGIGRQQLSRELRLGEGTVRTLARRMRGSGLIEATRSGMTLTSRGRDVLVELGGLILTREFPETPITVGSANFAVLVRGVAGDVRMGIEQRDAAMMAGARGATTLIYDGERLRMPGMDLRLNSSTVDFIHENLKPEEGDVIIIGSADDLFDAEIGAKSAAMNLLEKNQRR